MELNFVSRTIEMTKAEAKAASKYGTQEYNQLKEMRCENPTYQIVIKASVKRKNEFKGLTYEYMATYIKKHDKDGSIMEEFLILTGKKEKENEDDYIEAISYFEVKSWFLKTYPQIEQSREEYRKKVKNILESKKIA